MMRGHVAIAVPVGGGMAVGDRPDVPAPGEGLPHGHLDALVRLHDAEAQAVGATNGLKSDPGAYMPWTAWFVVPASRAGSKVGRFASASSSPVCGSSTRPVQKSGCQVAWSSSSAVSRACWITMSSGEAQVAPGRALRVHDERGAERAPDPALALDRHRHLSPP